MQSRLAVVVVMGWSAHRSIAGSARLALSRSGRGAR
jgi:hypothetical protein